MQVVYIFCSKVPSKCRKCRFRDSKFKIIFGMHPDPLQLCRYYDLPLTKILATLLILCRNKHKNPYIFDY